MSDDVFGRFCQQTNLAFYCVACAPGSACRRLRALRALISMTDEERPILGYWLPTQCSKRIRYVTMMRYTNLHFTYLFRTYP